MQVNKYEYDYYQYYYQYQYQLRRKRIAALAGLAILLQEEIECKRKKVKVASIFKIKNVSGLFKAVFPVLPVDDLTFHNFIRMNATQLENLLQLVGPDIHEHYEAQKPIETTKRVVMTLRFLANGDSITSISEEYKVDVTTASTIIYDVCKAIWNNLHQIVLPTEYTEEKWYKIAAEYEKMWNFPHCIGCIDGKHIVIQRPNNADSTYHKGTHSIVLLAMCTANYLYSFVDIGSYGRRCDAGIFKQSNFGVNFENGMLSIPPESPVYDGGPVLPFCILGDEAFPLKPNLLRPYPDKNVDSPEKQIFNSRINHAKRAIENTFGIMTNRWRIFRKPVLSSSRYVKEITQAVICLHNMLRLQDLEDEEVTIKYVTEEMVDRDGKNGLIPGSWRNDGDTGLNDITRMGNNGGTRAAFEVREKFRDYFNNEGSLD